jgi:hypothetical protein
MRRTRAPATGLGAGINHDSVRHYLSSWRMAVAGSAMPDVSVPRAAEAGSSAGAKLLLPVTAASRMETVSDKDSGGFLRIPAGCGCVLVFFWYAAALSVETFAPETARQLHNVPLAGCAVPGDLQCWQARDDMGAGRVLAARTIALRNVWAPRCCSGRGGCVRLRLWFGSAGRLVGHQRCSA